MFCGYCGTENLNNAGFCRGCGKALTGGANAGTANNNVSMRPQTNREQTNAEQEDTSKPTGNFPEVVTRLTASGVLLGLVALCICFFKTVVWGATVYIVVLCVAFSILCSVLSIFEIMKTNKLYRSGDREGYEKSLKGNKGTLIAGYVSFAIIMIMMVFAMMSE